MHGLRTIQELNNAVAAGEARAATKEQQARREADLRVVRYQNQHVVIAQTGKGEQFVNSHYSHERIVLGGRLIGPDSYFALKQSKVEAFGLTITE